MKGEDERNRPSRPTFEALEPRLLLNGTIAGQVWDDLNGDGVQDIGDVGVNGWTVELVDVASGTVVDMQVSASVDLDESGTIDPQTEAGYYTFVDLPVGSYSVRQVAQADWVQTTPLVPTGELNFVEFLRDGVGGVDGLNGARSVTVSGDGAHVYAAGSNDNAVAVFARDVITGKLNFVEVLKDGVDGVDGLGSACSVIVSSDGAHVYVAGYSDDAVAVFARDAATGQLSFIEAVKDGVGGVDGLNGAQSVTVSGDGAHVYVAGYSDDAVTVFARDAATGQLVLDGVVGMSDVLAVTVAADGAHVYATNRSGGVFVFARDAVTGQLSFVENAGAGIDGLNRAYSATVSGDGANVYVASLYDGVTVFSRDAVTGQLSFVQTVEDGVNGVVGLDGARWVTVSGDGAHVYAASYYGDAMVVFSRDAGTGQLSFVEVFKDGIDGVDGLGGATSVTVSGDGAHVYVAGRDNDAVAVFERIYVPGTIDVEVTAGMASVSADFGVFALSTAGGQVFADLDYDGVKDANEEGANGWTVELVDADGEVVGTVVTADMDVDGNGTIDPQTESGLYALTGVLPGSYEIRLVVPEFWSQTYPAGADHTYVSLSGYAPDDIDFGVASLPSVGGQVFNDTDRDGLHDSTEDGVNGWTIELVDPGSGAVIDTQVTSDRDADGNGTINPVTERGAYRFTDLLPGTYLVRQIDQDGWVQTFPVSVTYSFSGDLGDHMTEADFGNYQPSSISGQKWNDLDADGVHDADEPGSNGWTIELVDAGTGDVVATTVTGDVDLNSDGQIDPITETGLYSFADLPAGSFEVREVQQAGWMQTWLQPDVALRIFRTWPPQDVYDVPLTASYPYWLEGSHADFFREPGLWQVNDDVYADGTLNREDMPAYTPGADPNVYWWILEDHRVGPTYEWAAGDMDFYDLDIRVEVDPETGAMTLLGVRQVSVFEYTFLLSDGSTIEMGSASGVGPFTVFGETRQGPKSIAVNILGGNNVTGVDFSNFLVGGSVTGQHFNDLNANGLRDNGEVGLDGWTVQAVDPVSGQVVDSAVTASVDVNGDGAIDPATETGLYMLASMPAVTFDIQLVVPENWVQTAPAGNTHTVTVAAEDSQSGFDFAAAQLGVLSGQLFNDADSNGQQDAGEFGINGWTVELIDTDTGAPVATTTSGGADLDGDGAIDPLTEAGRYAFSGLSAGNYETRVASAAGWAQTSPMTDPPARLFAVRGSGTAMTIHELSPADGSTLNSFPAPAPTAYAGIQGLAVGPNSLFYLDGGNPAAQPVLWELDLDTGAVIDTDMIPVAIPAMAMGVAWLDGKVYIQHQPGVIAVFDPAADTIVGALTVAGNAAGGLAAAGDLGLLFAGNNAGQILVIDPATGAIVNTLSPGVGVLSGGLAYCNGELIAGAMTLDGVGTAYRIDPVTGGVLGMIHLGAGGSKLGGLGGDYDPPAEPIWQTTALAADEHADDADYGYHSSHARGDMDGDGDVDAEDIDLLSADFADAGHAGPQSDLDGDGDADQADMDIMVHDLVETAVGIGTEYGDFNLDGLINTTDLTILATNFGAGTLWSEGNANSDSVIDTTDLAILATHSGFVATPAGDAVGVSADTETAAAEVPQPVEDSPSPAPLLLSTSAPAYLGAGLGARIELADAATLSAPAPTRLAELAAAKVVGPVAIIDADVSLGDSVQRVTRIDMADTDVNLPATWSAWSQNVADRPAEGQTAPPVMTGERSVPARPLTLPRRQAASRWLSMNVQAPEGTDMLSDAPRRSWTARPASRPSDLHMDLVNILDETERLAAL